MSKDFTHTEGKCGTKYVNISTNYTSKLNDRESTETSILSVQIYHSLLKKRSIYTRINKMYVNTTEIYLRMALITMSAVPTTMSKKNSQRR